MQVTLKLNTIRYYVISDLMPDNAFIFDTETGRTESPECWMDMNAFYHFLVDRGRIEEAQDLLGEIMAGHKPISRMKQVAVTPA